MSRLLRLARPLRLILLAAGLLAASRVGADERVETRKQAVIRASGDVDLKRGGYVVEAVAPDGPASRLELVSDGGKTRGVLEKGDIITAVEGKRFKDRREYLDLMNDAYGKNKGTVRLTVKDASTGNEVAWVARPLFVESQVPAKKFDLRADIGDPVPAAPFPPAVPATVKP